MAAFFAQSTERDQRLFRPPNAPRGHRQRLPSCGPCETGSYIRSLAILISVLPRSDSISSWVATAP